MICKALSAVYVYAMVLVFSDTFVVCSLSYSQCVHRLPLKAIDVRVLVLPSDLFSATFVVSSRSDGQCVYRRFPWPLSISTIVRCLWTFNFCIDCLIIPCRQGMRVFKLCHKSCVAIFLQLVWCRAALTMDKSRTFLYIYIYFYIPQALRFQWNWWVTDICIN